MSLIIWDRIFGTFQPEIEHEKVMYGLTKNPEHPHHPIQIITHEWKAIYNDLKKDTTFYKSHANYQMGVFQLLDSAVTFLDKGTYKKKNLNLCSMILNPFK